MKKTPQEIYKEYTEGVELKASIGAKGLYEQSRINERFFVGDQWYGARCGGDRPLVRHNVIRRIGEYKMGKILSTPVSVRFSAEGIPQLPDDSAVRRYKAKIARNPEFDFEGVPDSNEINAVLSALEDYRNVTAERVDFDSLCARALREAFISGSSVLYTYWDSSVISVEFDADKKPFHVKGDIKSEVLSIDDVYFGDPYLDGVQQQPYIIIASRQSIADVQREATACGAGGDTLAFIGEGDADGKILVLTKLYREYKKDGESTIRCLKVSERAVIKPDYDTGLRLYPIALFNWEERKNLIYGDSEVTHLLPNQIAINRMITANVWSAMSMGMPIMVVNGDAVSEEISNEPGQVVRVFGTTEEVRDAVHYVAPPEVCTNFGTAVERLIENTLTQSGVNEAARGDAEADNASALITLQNAAVVTLNLVKRRFYGFIEDASRIWADFWLTQYGRRSIKVEDENGAWYLPFDTCRYGNMHLNATVDVGPDSVYSTAESISLLNNLIDRGIISKRQYLKRLPKGIISDVAGLIREAAESEEKVNDGV